MVHVSHRWMAAIVAFPFCVCLGAGFAIAEEGSETTADEEASAGNPGGAPGPNEVSEDDTESDEETSSDDENVGEGGEASFENEEDLFEIADDDQLNEPGDEEASEGRGERRDGIPLRRMDRKQAERAGFKFGDDNQTGARTTGAFLAVTGGTVLHGLGHWYVDDQRTALTLAAVEGSSLLLVGAGLGLWLGDSVPRAGRAYGGAAFHIGAGLFGLSYLTDVIGALQDARLRLPANTARPAGVAIQTGYQYLNADSFPFQHFLVARADYAFGRVFGEVRTRQDFRLQSSEYETEVGVRLLRGKREETSLYLAARGDWLSKRGDRPYRRGRGEARVGVSLDLGVVAPHLEQVVAGVDAGWGGLANRRPTGEDSFAWRGTSWYLPVEVYTDMNLSERLNVHVSYDKRAGELLDPSGRLAGVGGVRLRYDSSELFDLEIAGRFGDGYALQAGLLLRILE